MTQHHTTISVALNSAFIIYVDKLYKIAYRHMHDSKIKFDGNRKERVGFAIPSELVQPSMLLMLMKHYLKSGKALLHDD